MLAAVGETAPAASPAWRNGGLVGRGQFADAAAVDADFERFVAARAPALVWLARGLLRDPHHAEDVVQEVLVRAHRRWASIAGDVGPEPYVRRMVINASVSFWRRAARREIAFAREDLPSLVTADRTGAVAERDLLLQLLRRIPPRQRAVLVLRHYEDLPDEEIATTLGCSVSTVRSNAHRGLARLRELLSEATSNQEVRL